MALSKKAKKWLTGIIIGLSAGAFISGFTNLFLHEAFESLERISYDFRYFWKYVLEPQNRQQAEQGVTVNNDPEIEGLVIVDIDERAMAKLGPFNKWPRYYHGDVVHNLSKGGASGVVFDIMFKTADWGQKASEEVLDILKKADPAEDWEKFRPTIRQGLNDDSIFVDKVGKSKGVIGAALMNNASAYPNKSDWEHMSNLDWHQEIHPQSTALLEPPIRNHFETKPILDNVFPAFAHSCDRMGLVNVVPERDGIHRWIPLLYNFPDPKITNTDSSFTYSAIALQAAMHLLGTDLSQVEIKPGRHINLGAPLRVFNKKNRLQVSYPGLTLPMVRSLIEKSEQVLQMGPENPDLLTISTPVVVVKYAEDDYEFEILEGGYLTWPMYEALANSEALDEILKKVDAGEEQPLNESKTLTKGEGKNRYRLTDLELEEEVILDRYTIDVLNQFDELVLNEMADGEKKILSSQLDISYDIKRDRYISSIMVLTRDVFESMQNVTWNDIQNLPRGSQYKFGKDISIPIDESGRMLINYQGLAHKTFRYLSYYDVLGDRLDPLFYQNKAFLLGSSAPAMFDIVASPFSEEFPGVEIHATLIHNILTKDFMQRMSWGQTMALLLGLGMVIGLLSYFLPALWSALLVLFTGAAYFFISIFFFNNGWWLEVARPEITIFATFLSVMVARYMFEEKDKKFLNDAFKNYISPELIDMMVETGEKPSLGGQEAILSAYFTDIQSFSTFSEKLGSPTKLVELLNEYLTAMTDILIANNGTLDKYEGDAIIAFFGAPVQIKDHALVACQTALDMQSQLAVLREKWQGEGDKWPKIVHEMRMRIGINSGPIVTGNMGSKMRMNYTMMGDTVNLAARLESGAKMYGVYGMVSEETIKLVGNGIFSRELDIIKVVGKDQPVKIFELMAKAEETNREMMQCRDTFNEGIKLYREQNWDKAIEAFSESLKLEPNHPDRAPGCKTTPSHLYIKRCEEYKITPPVPAGQTWDGIFTATEK